MTPKQAAEILRKHNEWRRFEGEPKESPEMTPPKLIGEAIAVAVEYIESRERVKP
jgi:hypothetical protein